jgi:hypothetical protein
MPSVDQVVDRFGRQSYLAGSLVCYLIADAFIPQNRLLTYSILGMLIVSGPLATAKGRGHRTVTVVLAVAMVGMGYLTSLRSDYRLDVAASLIAAAFFLDLIYLLSRALLMEQSRVTAETLWAAINVYLLFGMLFAFLYSAVLAVQPHAFSGGMLENESLVITQSMIYYSFVTMTTLGYGDITPKTQVAATLAYVQALIGQLYVAILIARLVSLYSVRTDKE